VAGPIGIAAMMCLLRATLSGSTVLCRLPLGPWEITFTREGLQGGILVGSHVLGSVSVIVLLGSVTPAYKVFGALQWAGMPGTLVELAMLMYRYIFSLLEEANNVHSAQRVRLGYVNSRRSLSSTGELMGLVILRAFDQADRTHEAMLVRGYRHRLPMAAPGPLGARDLLTLAAGLVVFAAGFLLCRIGPI
jgi:cobalt/nickel transport system permease protein